MPRAKRYFGIALLAASAAALGNLPAVAEEIDFYESLSDVDIGRVFLSPEQRAHLDTRPVRPPQRQDESPVAETVERKKNPAGYIINSSGESIIWSQLGFVAGDDARKLSFPGDVEVIRKEAAESAVEVSVPATSPDDKPGASDNGV